MSNNNNSNLLEEYKELGLQFRHYASEIASTNRLMLPPLVIGLLVLCGEVQKFLGVELHNAETVHSLIWSGCFMIALMWVFHVSRLARILQENLNTLRKSERKLGLDGHTNIAKMDFHMAQILPYSKILVHHVMRLIGFWIYLSALLSLSIKSWNVNEVLPPLGFLSFCETHIWWMAVGVSGYLSVWIGIFYFDYEKLSSLSYNASKTIRSILKLILRYLPATIIILIFLISLCFFLANNQLHLDANTYLVSGLESYADGDYQLAISKFNKVIKLDSNNFGAYLNRGAAYYKKGEIARSIVDLDKTIALDPQNSHARNLRDEARRKLENINGQ